MVLSLIQGNRESCNSAYQYVQNEVKVVITMCEQLKKGQVWPAVFLIPATLVMLVEAVLVRP
jgi:hypothetical protein